MVILLNKILRNHLPSENMQWNYVSFKVTLNYPMHEIMEFCVTSSLALDNWKQKYCQTLDNNQTIHTVCCEDDYSLVCFTNVPCPRSLFSIENLFVVRYLWDVWNEDKCCFVTQRAADTRVAWLVYFWTYCVPIATLNQNKRTRLLYLDDAQIITYFLCSPCLE